MCGKMIEIDRGYFWEQCTQNNNDSSVDLIVVTTHVCHFKKHNTGIFFKCNEDVETHWMYLWGKKSNKCNKHDQHLKKAVPDLEPKQKRFQCDTHRHRNLRRECKSIWGSSGGNSVDFMHELRWRILLGQWTTFREKDKARSPLMELVLFLPGECLSLL